MTRIAALAISIAIAIPALGAPQIARAQGSESAAARQTFQDGVRAAREERWADAVDMFQQSYELAPRPVTMMNLAGALAQIGRLVEAAEAYRSFLSVARTGTAARLRPEAEAQLRSLEGRIPRVRMRVLGLEEGDVVRLDEYEVSPAALDLPLPIDPGHHAITIERRGQERSIPFVSAEGVASEIVLDARAEAWGTDPLLPTVDPDALRTDGRAGGGGSTSIVEEPAFWIVIGAVVLAGAAVGIGVGISSQQAGPLYVGNLAPAGIGL